MEGGRNERWTLLRGGLGNRKREYKRTRENDDQYTLHQILENINTKY